MDRVIVSLVVLLFIYLVISEIINHKRINKESLFIAVNKDKGTSLFAGCAFIIISIIKFYQVVKFNGDYLNNSFYELTLVVGYLIIGLLHISKMFIKEGICSFGIARYYCKYLWKRVDNYEWGEKNATKVKGKLTEYCDLEIRMKDRFYQKWFKDLTKYEVLKISMDDYEKVDELLRRKLS